jgi:hypothetical protein
MFKPVFASEFEVGSTMAQTRSQALIATESRPERGPEKATPPHGTTPKARLPSLPANWQIPNEQLRERMKLEELGPTLVQMIKEYKSCGLPTIDVGKDPLAGVGDMFTGAGRYHMEGW